MKRLDIVLYFTPLLLSGCGGGWTDSGYDIDLCSGFPRNWEGPASSNSGQLQGIMSLELKAKDCKLTGAIVFQPCVPVTPVEGTANVLGGFKVTSLDGSISVLQDNFNINIDVNLQDDDPNNDNLFDPAIQTYEFRNTQNRPNCPASDTGTHQMQPVGG